MALNALRLRRALSFSSALISRSTTNAFSTATVCRSPIFRFPFSSPPPPPSTTDSFPVICSRCVHSTSLSLSASRSFNHGDDQIDENTILFEGCDYKHWLITMDFPKDPRPSPEEMVETYVQTLAKVLGSVEEAKKRMYACSTTTYTGFQAEMDEETANKFESLPGVVFVLPDSYIDPVNKEYGGDKYINGEIIHRPPPVQYGRQRRPRGPPQNSQGYPEPRRMQRDGPNFTPQQNFQQQNYVPPRQNFPPQQNYPPRENHGPMHNNPPQQNFAPSQNYPPQQNYAPPQQNFAPPSQGERMGPTPPYNQGSNNQGGGYPSRNQRDYGEGRQNFASPSSGGSQYGGQGGRGSYGQNQAGPFENGTGGSYGQGTNSEYGQGYAARGENRPFNPPPGEQNIGGQSQQRNYPSTGRD